MKRSDFTKDAITEIVRVWHDGGTGYLMLPQPATGARASRVVNQRSADEVVAWLLDKIIADLLEAEKRGDWLSDRDKETLHHWRTNVPHSYSVFAPLGGATFVRPQDASGGIIGHESDSTILAADPSAYGLPWIVHTAKRQFPGMKGKLRFDSLNSSRLMAVGMLEFPPGTDLFAVWARFHYLNTEQAIPRLSAVDRRRYLLPYGVTRERSGRETLFNRDYKPFLARQGKATTAERRFFYGDGHSEKDSRRLAETALDLFLRGKQLPPDCDAADEQRPANQSQKKPRLW
jgi:hypothetical protein